MRTKNVILLFIVTYAVTQISSQYNSARKIHILPFKSFRATKVYASRLQEINGYFRIIRKPFQTEKLDNNGLRLFEKRRYETDH